MPTSIRRVRTPIGQVQLVDDGKTTDRPIDIDELEEGNGHPLEVERDIASVVEGAAATTDRDQDADMDAKMEYPATTNLSARPSHSSLLHPQPEPHSPSHSHLMPALGQAFTPIASSHTLSSSNPDNPHRHTGHEQHTTPNRDRPRRDIGFAEHRAMRHAQGGGRGEMTRTQTMDVSEGDRRERELEKERRLPASAPDTPYGSAAPLSLPKHPVPTSTYMTGRSAIIPQADLSNVDQPFATTSQQARPGHGHSRTLSSGSNQDLPSFPLPGQPGSNYQPCGVQTYSRPFGSDNPSMIGSGEQFSGRSHRSTESPPDVIMSDFSPSGPMSIGSTRAHSRRGTDGSNREVSPPPSSFSGSHISGSQYLASARRAASPVLGTSFHGPGAVGMIASSRERDASGRRLSGGIIQPYPTGYTGRRGSIGEGHVVSTSRGERYVRARSPLSDSSAGGGGSRISHPVFHGPVSPPFEGLPMLPPHAGSRLHGTALVDARQVRIESEQRRRDELRDGFMQLKALLPPSAQRASKCSILERAAQLIHYHQEEQRRLIDLSEKLTVENERLRDANFKLVAAQAKRLGIDDQDDDTAGFRMDTDYPTHRM